MSGARFSRLVHVPNFGALSGSEDRGGGDNSIQFINIGRVGGKCFKERGQNIGGGRVGDNNILTIGSTKSATLKKLHFGQFLLFIFVKFRNSWPSLLV